MVRYRASLFQQKWTVPCRTDPKPKRRSFSDSPGIHLIHHCIYHFISHPSLLGVAVWFGQDSQGCSHIRSSAVVAAASSRSFPRGGDYPAAIVVHPPGELSAYYEIDAPADPEALGRPASCADSGCRRLRRYSALVWASTLSSTDHSATSLGSDNSWSGDPGYRAVAA